MHGGRQVLWGWSSTVKYKLKIGTVKVNICRTAHSANPQCKTLQVVLLHFHTAQPITKLLCSNCKASKYLKKPYDMLNIKFMEPINHSIFFTVLFFL